MCTHDATRAITSTTWGQPLDVIKIMGCIQSIRHLDGVNLIMVNDATGSLAVLYNTTNGTEINADDPESHAASHRPPVDRPVVTELGFSVNQYVAVWGKVCHMERARGNPSSHFHLDAIQITPIQDFNELTHHMLDVIHTQLTRAAARSV